MDYSLLIGLHFRDISYNKNLHVAEAHPSTAQTPRGCLFFLIATIIKQLSVCPCLSMELNCCECFFREWGHWQWQGTIF